MLRITGETHTKVQYFRVRVSFYLLRVQYPWYHCFLCLSPAVEKSLSGEALSTFRTTAPALLSQFISLIISKYSI